MRGRVHPLGIGGVLFAVLAHATGASAASNWATAINAGSNGEAQAQTAPSAPSGVTATCTSALQTTVDVSWNAVAHATTYTIFESTTSSSTGFSSVATGVVGTSWRSPSLPTGSYWFEVVAYVGTNWTSPNSAATAQRTIALLTCA